MRSDVIKNVTGSLSLQNRSGELVFRTVVTVIFKVMSLFRCFSGNDEPFPFQNFKMVPQRAAFNFGNLLYFSWCYAGITLYALINFRSPVILKNIFLLNLPNAEKSTG